MHENLGLLNIEREKEHCVKSVQIMSFIWSVFSRIRTEYGEIRTRKNSVFGHFSRSRVLKNGKERVMNIDKGYIFR